jgi:hypothetical protein
MFFIFFRSARIIAKNPWSCLYVPKNTIYFLCLIYLLSVNFFPIPSFLLHLLVTVKNAHRKTQPISSQSSHKKHIYCCTFGSFLREIKIPKQDPTSPYPVSLSSNPAQREWREQEGKLSGEKWMRTGDEEQISDRRERTERERTGEWWWCPALWICDRVLLLQRTGEWLERTEREQGKRDNRERTISDRRERTISDRRERTNSETIKARGMRGFQKLNEGNQRGMRGEFEKPNERNRLRGAWETEWDGNDSGMKPNERRNWMMMRWCL